MEGAVQHKQGSLILAKFMTLPPLGKEGVEQKNKR